MPLTQEEKFLKRARENSEYCTFAYQMYATLLQYSHDPFHPGYGDRKLLQEMLKTQAQSLNQPVETQLDYTSYDYSKLDLKQPVYQGEGGVTGAGIYFEPPEFAGRIARVFHNDKVVSEYPNLTDRDDSIDIYLLDGTTGSSEDHDGFPSTMWYVAYDRKTNQVTVTFRGSRSGSAVQGALGGLYSKTGILIG